MNNQKYIEHFTEDKIELTEKNLSLVSEITDDDITIFYQNKQLFSKINLSRNNYLVKSNIHPDSKDYLMFINR